MRVDQTAEVAVAHGFGGHAVLIGGVGDRANRLIGGEEECLVAAVVDLGNNNRAASRDAKLVAVQERSFGEGVLPAAGDAVAAVAVGFKQSAVELVGAALAAEEDGGRAGELRRGVIGLDVNLLHSVQAGRTAEIPAFPDFVDRGAIEHRRRGVGPHPVSLRNAGGVDAGHRSQKVLIASAVDRELLDALPLNRMGQRRVLRGDQGRDILDLDLRRRLADLQDYIDRRILLGLDSEVGLVLLHARGLDGEAVRPGKTPGKTNDPASFDVVVRATFVAVLVKVTLASGTTAWP